MWYSWQLIKKIFQSEQMTNCGIMRVHDYSEPHFRQLTRGNHLRHVEEELGGGKVKLK